MTLHYFAENLPLLFINAFSGWILAVTFYYHGVRMKPFACAKCMAFWLTVICMAAKSFPVHADWYSILMALYLVISLSLVSAVIAIVIDKKMMKL